MHDRIGKKTISRYCPFKPSKKLAADSTAPDRIEDPLATLSNPSSYVASRTRISAYLLDHYSSARNQVYSSYIR
jgi:hypothetical protein